MGRPANIEARLRILQSLGQGYSIAEVVRAGPYSRDQVKRWVRALLRQRLVVPATDFSHLPVDGPGAKRYALTEGGQIALSGRGVSAPLGGNSTTGGGGNSTDVKRPGRPAGVVGTAVSAPPRGPVRIASQVFVGLHAACARYELEGPPGDTSGWVSRVLSGVTMRYLTLGKGPKAVRLQISADRTLTAKYSVPVNAELPELEQPSDVESRKVQIAFQIRDWMARVLDCSISEPKFVGRAKWSVLGDPVAKAVRGAGITLHGEGTPEGIGVDDTPEEGTLEFTGEEAPGKVRDYIAGVTKTGRAVIELQAQMSATEEAVVALLQSEALLQRSMRELLARSPKAPEMKPVPPLDRPWEGGYA